MSNGRYIKPQGELRQSQVVMTFGPGSMVDLPKHSVLIAGLDYWSGGGTEIFEARLAAKAARLLELPSVRLVTPPPADDDPLGPNPHIEAFQFPEWFITQDNERDTEAMFGRTRLLVHRKALSRGAYIDRNKKRRSVVPIRFVRACRCGHIGDIDWYAFVHQGKSECTQQQRQLLIDERGTSGDLTEIFIRCECGKAERSVAQAARFQDRALGNCDGSRPWLGPFTKESCGEPSRLLIRSASNAYFPQTLSVISLPDRDESVRKAVDAAWDYLEIVETKEDLEREMRRPKVREALDGISLEEAFAQIQARHAATPTPDKSVKQAELETLAASKEEIGSDQPEGVFYARSLQKTIWDQPWMKPIERIVLVHRLREVVAQVGFTRFESAAPDIEGELDLGVKRAVLAREMTWLPAYENKGEGIFLKFSAAYLNDWAQRPEVAKQGIRLKQGFDTWKAERQGSSRTFPGLPYIALHGFSHLLLTALALECGYPASSIRERIYAIPSVGYGVLLYTGSSDAEGTLGGLIQVGRRIHNSVRSALELGLLCSNDPVCAQHDPENRQEQSPPARSGMSWLCSDRRDKLRTAKRFPGSRPRRENGRRIGRRIVQRRRMVMKGLLALSVSDLAALKEALRTGRLPAPFLPTLIERIVPRAVSGDVSASLRGMAAAGTNREGLVASLELLAAARAQQPSIDEVIELVTTGPGAGTVTNRDTQVVVQELFRNAERSVLVAGYELYQAEPVFRTLAERMADQPRPTIQLFLNVKRPFGDTSTDSELIAAFAYRFRTQHWPTDRPLPEIYFDPRSLAMDTKRKAVLHAKCVVIDGRTSFVSSANFTEAAQERNIEVGVLVRSPIVAERLIAFFSALTGSGAVRRAL